MNRFDHERLDVYQVALQFLILAHKIVEYLPKGHSHLSNQLQRAALSISLNIAEGEKARFYRIARRSATECASIIDICRCLKLVKQNLLANGRELLLRVVAMLTRLVKAQVKT
ncbi:four helix bundle protein [Candidatus Uabimicrobium sp. HlEnr_7]|uniref:four helix bundle protein n=1 Tax=Candidatus Uabimicrobium helgolandensis TaxID=3095367 RepID=UPI003557C908